MKINKLLVTAIVCTMAVFAGTVSAKAETSVSAKQIAKYAESYLNNADTIVATAYANTIDKTNYIMDTGINKKTNVMYYNNCTEDTKVKTWCDGKVCYKYNFDSGKWSVFSKSKAVRKYRFGISVPDVKYLKKMSDSNLNGIKCYRVKAYGYAEYYVSKEDKSLVGIVSRHGKKKVIILLDDSSKVAIPSYVKKCKKTSESTVNKGEINAYSYRCSSNIISDVKITSLSGLKKVINNIKSKRTNDNKNDLDEIIRELTTYKASYFKTNDLYIKNYKASSNGRGMYAIQKKLTTSGNSNKLSLMFTTHYEDGIIEVAGYGYVNAVAVVETKKGILKKVGDIKISKDKNCYMLPYVI
ncbi:MAG: hypothetical protein K2M78_10365 [Lachnospiraceae bacterium]|nr:hypothetical protein [Lachnospiraceae bacterium]